MRSTSTKAVGAALTFVLIAGPLHTNAQNEYACAQISIEISTLLRQKLSLQTSFWDEPGNQAAAIGAMTFTPAVYPSLAYLTVSGAKRLPNKTQARSIQARIDELRAHSADKQCYVEPIYHY